MSMPTYFISRNSPCLSSDGSISGLYGTLVHIVLVIEILIKHDEIGVGARKVTDTVI